MQGAAFFGPAIVQTAATSRNKINQQYVNKKALLASLLNCFLQIHRVYFMIGDLYPHPFVKNSFFLKKLVCSAIVFAILLTQGANTGFALIETAHAQTAYAAEVDAVDPAEPENDPQTVYDLVVIVLDQALDNGNYLGLKNKYPLQYADKLEVNTISERALRYAEDLRINNDLTDVKILLFDKQKDDVQSLAAALENLYVNGDGPHNNKLAGVVLIGDIPLPVVNKNGNRYVSMYPYTDFEDKSYVYNAKKNSFEQNPDSKLPVPEVWHGIMRPPTNNAEGYDKLAEYLDKNHLYYEGVNDFAQFDRKMFFGDLLHEEEQMNGEIYKKYLDYLSSWEDLIYQRYNKFWASELIAKSVKDLPINEDNPANQGPDGFGDMLKDGDFLKQIPDIHTKSIIDQNLPPYFKIFSKYISKTNDFASNTGRYRSTKSPSEVNSAASVIAIKDEYTKYYLRSVNDALEKKVNSIVGKLEDPIPLLTHSTLSGKFSFRNAEGEVTGEEDFAVGVNNAGVDAGNTDKVFLRYNYWLDKTDKLFVNGIDGDILENAKQCSVYLGSTKDAYFDAQTLDYNPKQVNGEYSILTRALRSDNKQTIMPLRTSGVNTRLLSTASISGNSSELQKATENAYSGNINSEGIAETGEIIENNPEYGVSAFLMNPYAGDYQNPFDSVLEPNDVIVNVNGKNISYEYTFDQAIRNSYLSVEKVIKAVNDKQLSRLAKFPYKIATYVPAPPQNPLAEEVIVSNNAAQIMDSQRLKNAVINEGDVVAGVISVEYYRKGENGKKNATFTFSVVVGDKNNGKIGNTSSSNGAPSGNPKMLVILSNHGYPNNFYNEGTDGAIFSLYENDTMGFGGDAYDSSAGCNAKSTSKNSDRCLAKVATMPALDPAGALMPVKMTIPGVGVDLKFPENVKKNNQEQNSGNAADWQKHVEVFQYPEGKSFEAIDEVYYNSCYDGVPAFPADSEADSNPFGFVLDITSKGGEDKDINIDFYGKLLNSFAAFLESDRSDEPDYENGAAMADSSDYNPKQTIWLGLDKIDASQVVVNNPGGNVDASEIVTLKDFSDRYGLFDGKDNDNDGIRDYEWRDKNADGVYETKYYDFDEASEIYKIPSSNLQEISRKMLSHDSVYTVPYGHPAFPYNKFDEDITLEVATSGYKNKKLSSVIIHNEPTDYTISEQVKSQMAFSLPIDNPRYVAFIGKPKEGIVYPDPEPINFQVNVPAILAQVDLQGKNPHYTPGEVKKVTYLNVFDESVKIMPEFKNLITQKADEIAGLPFSYKIFGDNTDPDDYTLDEIKEEVKSQLLATISAAGDDPPKGFELKATSEAKLADALKWKAMNIDDKHQYVLSYYLNDDKDHYAYVNDATVFPAIGPDIGFGYEATYLLLDGDKDYVDFAFNKDLPEETDATFDPLSLEVGVGEDGGEGDGENEEEGDGGGGGSDDAYSFVALDQFLKELGKFIKGFENVTEFSDACSFAEIVKDEISGESEQISGEGDGDGVATIEAGLAELEDDAPPSKKVVLHTYVVSEISGFDEIKDLLEEELKAGGDVGSGQSGDGGEADGSGGESEGGDVGDGGSGSENGSGDSGDGSDGDGDGDGGTEDGSVGGALSNKDDTNVDEDFSGELKNIIAENEADSGDGAGSGDDGDGGGANSSDGDNGQNGGVGDGTNSGSNEGDVGGGENGSGTSGSGEKAEGSDKNIKILESTPVEDETNENTGEKIERENGDGSDEDTVNEDDVDAGDKNLTGEETNDEAEDEASWSKYFIDTKYYKRFLPAEKQSRSSMIAAVISDQDLLIENELSVMSGFRMQSSSSIVADGKSIMTIEAEVRDKEGSIEIQKKHNVRFRIENVDVKTDLGDVASFEDATVSSENGIAINYLKVGKRTGKIKVIAEVISGGNVDESYITQEQEIFLVAGEPVSLDIQSDSSFLVANGVSKTSVTVTMKDKFGNIADNAFNQLAVFSDKTITISEEADADTQLIGTQINTFEGKAKFDLYSTDKVGKASLIAVLMDYDLSELLLDGDNAEEIDFTKYVSKLKSFDLVDKNKVSLELKVFDVNLQPTSEIIANGDSIVRLQTKLLLDGNLAAGYSGPVKFNVVDKGSGKFVSEPPEKMLSGQLNAANLNFRASKVASNVEVLAEIPGFVSGTFKFKTIAGPVTKIELTSTNDNVYTEDPDGIVLTARLLDANGNLAEKNNGTDIDFVATDATKTFIDFSPAAAATLKGEASTTVYAKALSGVANIKANGAGLASDSISLKITKHLVHSDFEEISPRTLYIALLGGAFGKIEKTKNLAQTLLYSDGRVQIITALSASASEKMRLFSTDAYGKIALMSDNLDTEVFAATQGFPYQKVLIKDLVEQVDLAEIFLVPEVNTPLILVNEPDMPIGNGEAIYVKALSKGEAGEIVFSEKADGIYIMEGQETLVKIDKFGRIITSDKDIKINFPSDDPKLDSAYFSLVINRIGEDLAQIVYKQTFNKNVTALDYDENPPAYFPGIFVRPKNSSNKHKLTPALSGSSSSESLGLYFVDSENAIDPGQLPGGSYLSLENAANQFGMGYEGTNKQMLFFAAGNSMGESSLPYASDAAITFGDPLIRLKVEGDLVSDSTGYSKDIGKPIFNDQKDIQKLIPFDYNGDGFDDLLLAYEDGLIRLLENEISNKRFRDKGTIINLTNGIFSLTKIDVNNDSYDDLVVGTKESCNADEQCLSLFKNNQGTLQMESLELNLSDKKAYEMKADDMDNDGCEDLVISDSSGKISIFYNSSNGDTCTGLSKNAGYSKNYGFNLQDQVNLADQIFVNYGAMEQPNGVDPNLGSGSNAFKFIQFVLPTTALPANNPLVSAGSTLQQEVLSNPNIASKEVPPQVTSKEYNFINIKHDNKLGVSSAKQAIDVNGGSVELLDKIDYLIVLKNDSGSNINNLMISDLTPLSLRLLEDSLQCMDANCDDEIVFQKTGMSLRSQVIKNISVPANGQRTIKYSMVVEKMPKVKFDIGNDFGGYPEDDFRDILIKPEVNPDGIVRYLYSTAARSYAEKKVSPNSPSQQDILENTFEEQGLPNPTQALSETQNATVDTELSEDLKDQAAELAGKSSEDKDYNGCVDNWQAAMQGAQDSLNDINNAADAVATGIENSLNQLRCNGGGCLPIPYNYAFLAADQAIPGFPVINVWNAPPYVVPFSPSMTPASIFRLYASPTLTMGLGTAVCAGPGPGHQSPCFAFAVPGGIPGLCEGLNKLIDEASGAVNSLVAKATESVVDSDVGLGAVISDGEGEFADDPSTAKLGANYADSDSPFSAAASANVKIPSFPSVLTNWLDKQTDEIYNKLLDLPDFYLILPDFGKLGKEIGQAGSKVNFRSFNDFLSSLSKIPLIQIEGREVVIKVPAISQKEIEKYKYQAQFWLEHMKNELKKYSNWDCEETPERKTICDKILLDITNLISSVKELMEFLDQVASLPRDILNYKNMEAKYATQIICYLDAIMNYTGGYIKRQEKIIRSWMKAIQEVTRAFKSWQALLDLQLDYQQSCDKCKNDRFSKLGLLMQLFVAIPDPPIIPLPKWPDIIVDLSNVKTGVNIVWPDVVFRPQPIILPNLPEITLPDIIPEITISFDYKLDLPDLSKIKFMIPDLPDLPPLPLPKLPDLPRPPKIPALPNLVVKLAASLKPIFKILCLLKNGLIPINEASLATEIETLTQPNIKVVLPIIKNLAMQWPPIQYDYVREVRLNTKLSFDIDTSFIYIAVDSFAEVWNDHVKKFVDVLNSYTTRPYGEIINQFLQKAADAAKKQLEKKINEGAGVVGEETGGAVDAGSTDGDEQAYIDQVSEVDKLITEFIADLDKEEYPESYTLIAESNFIDSSDKLLHRSLAQVEEDIKKRKEDFSEDPYLANLANLRDQLIVYTEGINESNKILANAANYEDFTKSLLASDQNLEELSGSENLNVSSLADAQKKEESEKIAAETYPQENNSGTQKLKFSLFGEMIDNQIKEFANQTIANSERKLIADNADIGNGGALDEPASIPIGFYVLASNNLTENVLNYTAELGKNTQIIFSDADKDGDTDIVFSMSGDVYLKYNHKINKPLPKGDLIGDIVPVGLNNNQVGDYVNEGGTGVIGIKTGFENNKKVDVSWKKHSDDTYAYEVVFRDSIYASEADAKYKFIALTHTINTPESQAILDTLNISPPAEGEENPNLIELGDKEAPNISVKIENGNYFITVYAINKNGQKSLKSETSLASPQSCADKEPPLPVLTAQEGTAAIGTDFEISILKEFVVDAKNSFDFGGEIASYVVETLPYETDVIDPKSNQKLKTTNLQKFFSADKDPLNDGPDKDLFPGNDNDNPVFRIGPFENEGDIGKHEFILHLTDQNENKSSMKFSVKVFVPDITLKESVATTAVADGETKPRVSELPFKLMRSRYIYRVIDEELKLIPRLSALRELLTDAQGEYKVEDFDLEEMILVENTDGVIVAEIHPKTGNIKILVEGYGTKVNQAKAPTDPTSVDIVDKTGKVLGSVYLVGNSNIDVKIHQQLGFDSENHKTLTGVNVNDTNADDEFIFINVPANDPNNPGAAVLINKTTKKVFALIDTGGNVQIIDGTVTLTKKDNDHKKDPLIIEIRVDNKVVGELFVSPKQGLKIVGPKDVPFAFPHGPTAGLLSNAEIFGKSPFTELGNSANSDELKSIVEDLYKKGILDDNDKEDLQAEDLVKRKEFVKVLIKMLCIIPRQEAYEAYKPGAGYFDVEFSAENLDQYYPYIKEGTLLGLVEGYKGERDSAGLLPFKQDGTITRAEAVKIILEALEMKGVLDLSTVKEGQPWYVNYMAASQDLTAYLEAGVSIKNNFIVTQEEAMEPNKEMTFEELLTMVQRVLEIYNCFETDDDADGMSDFCEAKFQIDDPNEDADNDALENIFECKNGLNPKDEDSDNGGTSDGKEIEILTNPLNKEDDQKDEDNEGLSSLEETTIYGTDPYNPDTDGGGSNDWQEVYDCKNPLDKKDDELPSQCDSEISGIYIVPSNCDSCPCASTFLNKAELIAGDTLFPLISKYYQNYYANDPKEKTYIFKKGNEVKIKKISK